VAVVLAQLAEMAAIVATELVVLEFKLLLLLHQLEQAQIVVITQAEVVAGLGAVEPLLLVV
jgi:hypothetical protein